MGMRLMPKSELDKAKATEQRVAVEEGLKLAKRVDNLRETAAAEEAALESFRRETVARISEEVSTLSNQRDSLRYDVQRLQSERKEALVPLDEAWEEVKVARTKLESDKKEIEEREMQSLEHEQAAKWAEMEAAKAIAHAKNLEMLAQESHSQAYSRAQEAAKDRDFAAKLREETEEYVKSVNDGLTHREHIVATRENSATIRETDIIAREKELADGWRLLRDREALLERNIKRIK